MLNLTQILFTTRNLKTKRGGSYWTCALVGPWSGRKTFLANYTNMRMRIHTDRYQTLLIEGEIYLEANATKENN